MLKSKHTFFFSYMKDSAYIVYFIVLNVKCLYDTHIMLPILYINPSKALFFRNI